MQADLHGHDFVGGCVGCWPAQPLPQLASPLQQHVVVLALVQAEVQIGHLALSLDLQRSLTQLGRHVCKHGKAAEDLNSGCRPMLRQSTPLVRMSAAAGAVLKLPEPSQSCVNPVQHELKLQAKHMHVQ